MQADQYYRQQLSREEQAVYHDMQAGICSLAASFPLPRLTNRQLSDIFFLLRLDHPEIFWVSGFRYSAVPDAETVQFKPEYIFKKKQILSHRQAMETRITRLVRQAADLSEAEKEQFVHDFICSSITYDKLKKPYSHEIIGPLGQGVGVCEGIAKSVKVLLDRLGIWCIIALSDNNPEKGIRYRHTWNIIRLNGQYYHLDATFDRSLSEDGLIRYDYYNLPDSHVFRDHEPSMYPLPVCGDNKNFWYREKKLSFTKEEELQSRIAQYVRKKKPLVFHWRGGYLTADIIRKIADMVRIEAEKKQLSPGIRINRGQSVVQIDFLAAPPEEDVTLQQADMDEQLEAADSEPAPADASENF